jgi:ADP-ribose pyrophosphatase YjhB (NUDIX family)
MKGLIKVGTAMFVFPDARLQETKKAKGSWISLTSFILLKRASGLWALPGGKLEFTENLSRCVEREITEELGVLPYCISLVTVDDAIMNGHETRYDGEHWVTVFYAGLISDEPRIMEPTKATDLVWQEVIGLDTGATSFPKPLFEPLEKALKTIDWEQVV